MAHSARDHAGLEGVHGGDDICWMQPGADGQLWAIQSRVGLFRRAPGTNPKTNKNAYE